jgi:hypothetical protein
MLPCVLGYTVRDNSRGQAFEQVRERETTERGDLRASFEDAPPDRAGIAGIVTPPIRARYIGGNRLPCAYTVDCRFMRLEPTAVTMRRPSKGNFPLRDHVGDPVQPEPGGADGDGKHR